MKARAFVAAIVGFAVGFAQTAKAVAVFETMMDDTNVYTFGSSVGSGEIAKENIGSAAAYEDGRFAFRTGNVNVREGGYVRMAGYENGNGQENWGNWLGANGGSATLNINGGVFWACMGPTTATASTHPGMGRLHIGVNDCLITYKYANGVELKCGTPRYSGFRCGAKFIGENGDWISTCRSTTKIPEGKRVDTAYKPKADFWRNCEANRKGILEGEPEKQVVRNMEKDHHRPWFIAMRSRKDTNITVEEANVSTISCILGYHAMNNVGYEIKWDPEKRTFVNPADAAKFMKCNERRPYSTMDALNEIRKRG